MQSQCPNKVGYETLGLTNISPLGPSGMPTCEITPHYRKNLLTAFLHTGRKAKWNSHSTNVPYIWWVSNKGTSLCMRALPTPPHLWPSFPQACLLYPHPYRLRLPWHFFLIQGEKSQRCIKLTTDWTKRLRNYLLSQEHPYTTALLFSSEHLWLTISWQSCAGSSPGNLFSLSLTLFDQGTARGRMAKVNKFLSLHKTYL